MSFIFSSPRHMLWSFMTYILLPLTVFGQSGITRPASGATIAPGETFRFEYDARADYGISSYAITVQLLTSDPGSTPETSFLSHMFAGDGQATGYYFGRFEYNVIGGPNPANPVPQTLTMPDFSQPPWNSGPVSDLTVYLAVFEEFSQNPGTVGKRIALASIPLIYNSSNPNPVPVCPTLSPATGSCGCAFPTHLCNATVDDPYRNVYEYLDTERECQNKCDSRPNCYSYLYTFTKVCWYSGNDTGAVRLVDGFNTGFIDPACKSRCDAAAAA